MRTENISKPVKWIVALGAASFCLSLATYLKPEFIVLLFSFLTFLAVVVCLLLSLTMGLLRWRRHSRAWAVPSLLCAAFLLSSLYLAAPMARHLSDRMFRSHVADYASIVQQFRQGSLNCSIACKEDVETVNMAAGPAHVRDVWGAHCDDGGVLVLFRLHNDVPLLHQGYLFADFGEHSSCGKLYGPHASSWSRIPYLRPVVGHWYRFSDQAGF